MKNYIQKGDTLSLPAPYTLASGDGALVGSIFGVANSDTPIGNIADLSTEGVFALPKASGALTIGQKVYWDDTAKKVSATAASNTLIGAAVESAASVVTICTVRLNGSFA